MIKSNIRTVINRVKRLEEELPKAMERAVAPKYWLSRLETSALKTLKAQWALERSLTLRQYYEKLTPRIIQTLRHEVLEGRHGIVYLLSIPGEDVKGADLAGAAKYNLGQRTPTGRIKKDVIDAGVFQPEKLDEFKADQENLERMRRIILDWVMLEKDWDQARDYHKDGSPMSPEEVAERIGTILGIGQSAAPGKRTAAMEDAAGRLAKAIQSWLEGSGESPAPNYDLGGQSPWGGSNPTGNQILPGPTISPETAAQWLAAVLLAWRSLFKPALPVLVRNEVAKTMAKVRSEMI